MSNSHDPNSLHLPRWDELPSMDLYMDQVVHFINEHLRFFKLQNQEKIVTNTMINNYVKNGIVEAPVKKRYTRTHVAYLMVVCILKNIYRMDEIASLINIQMQAFEIQVAYDYFCADYEGSIKAIFAEKKYVHVASEFEGSEEVTMIRNTVSSLAYSVYVRKVLDDRFFE